MSCDQDTSPTCSLTDVRQHLKDDQVMYCLLRLTTTFDMSTTVKFIYIHWSVFTCSVHEPSTAENLLGNILLSLSVVYNLPSVLWHCWLGGRKGIRSVKNEWWGTGMVICLEQDADLHMAQLMPLPLTVSCFNRIQTGFTFLVLAHPGSPRKRAVKRVCVCKCGI